MAFAVGETVAYPGYGAAVIEDLETRQMKGEDKTYLVLRIVAQRNLVVRVPACNLDLVGVRDCVDRAGLERVIAVLREQDVEELSIWSRRFKANSDKVRSGDVISVAEVVRDLWRRERAGTVSAAERQMLAKARQILVSEIAFCEQTDDATAQARLDELLDC
jgi:CarD family transcriptional regulator